MSDRPRREDARDGPAPPRCQSPSWRRALHDELACKGRRISHRVQSMWPPGRARKNSKVCRAPGLPR
eukprot:12926250-Prorocentrum_lima.AAC.1